MATYDEKKAARLQQWQDWLSFFITNINPDLQTIEYAPEILNEYYWRLAMNYIKPLLKSTDDQEHNIDHYKIISMSELTVMAVLPLTSKNLQKDKELGLINAEFAFFVAISIMLAWKIGGEPAIGNDALMNVYNYQEEIDVENKLYPQDFSKEHVQWLRDLNPAVPLPIISNSQTWRMVSIAARLTRKL